MKTFKILLIFVLLLNLNSLKSQTIGAGISYATSNSFNFEFLYKKVNNILKFGITFQNSDTLGELKDQQLSNYGRTVEGKGSYFYTIDLGYQRVIKDKISIDIEFSFGADNNYTNYIDKRFTEGGYYMIDNSETIIGAGANLGYYFNNTVVIFLGYNTIRKFQLGVRLFI